MIRRILVIGLCLSVFISAVIFLRSVYWTALTKSRDHFVEHQNEQEVYYETGAESYADSMANFMEHAIAIVEKRHFRSYVKPFKVYVCASQESLDEFIVNRSGLPIRGAALRGNVYISPSAFHFQDLDTHKESLMHELSHLHLQQQLGFLKRKKIPIWFHEGYADYVANSGGEGISEKQAIDYILNGHHFTPFEKGGILISVRTAVGNLSGPMFHRQVKMFVSFIADSNPDDFKSFVLKLQDGADFASSFEVEMGMDIGVKWDEFITTLGEEG